MLPEANYCTRNGDYVPDYPVKLKPYPQPEDVDPPQPAAVAQAAQEPRRTPVAYVSGPYRDARGTWHVERNIRRAEAVAVELWRMGFAVVCPHTNTRHMDGAFPDSDAVFIGGDLELVRRCDVCVMLPAWKGSAGANQERAAALEADVLVLYWERLLDRSRLDVIGHGGPEAAERMRQELAGRN